MRKLETRIMAAAVSIAVTLAVLLAGYTFYNKFIIQEPLINALSDTLSVNEVRVEKENSKYQITVALDKVDNLQSEFAKLDEIAAFHLASREYDLQVSDARDKQLTDFYAQLQPFIYEALAKDNYIWLNEEITTQIENKYRDVDFQFFIDAEMIYLQFDNGQETLYEIIPRALADKEVRT